MTRAEFYLKLKGSLRYCENYLNKRGFDEEFCEIANLGYIGEENKEEFEIEKFYDDRGNYIFTKHLIFQCDFLDNTLCMILGRYCGETPYKYKIVPLTKDYHKKSYIYNLNRAVENKEEPTFVTEGIVECIRFKQMGYNAVSMLGVQASNFAIDLIFRTFRNTIWVVDNDGMGLEFRKRITQINDRARFLEYPGEGFDEYFVAAGKDNTTDFILQELYF